MLVALAILQVNSERANATYLDNFYPFLTQGIDDAGGSSESYAEISRLVKDRFGLYIPPGAVRSIAHRMVQRKILIQEGVRLSLKPDIDRADVGGRTRQFAKQETKFLKQFCEFAASKGLTTSENDARDALIKFVEDHGIGLLHLHYGEGQGGGEGGAAEDAENDAEPSALDDREEDKRSTSELDMALAIFIRNLFANEDPLAKHVVGWVQGMMLASSIQSGSTEDILKPFRTATIFLDTRVLFRALGLSGDELREATLPTLTLSASAGANLACFAHTVAEMQDILNAIANSMRYGRRAERVQEVERHLFSKQGIRDRDVARLSDELQESIEAIGVQVVDKPPFDPYNLQIDEDKFRQELHRVLGQDFNQKAIERDVDSIASVYRLRGGPVALSLEDCRALFVTTSYGLYRAARNFFTTERSAIPLALMEGRLQTAVWLKHPIKMGENLPRAQTIAHCYAALQPNPRLWELYLKRLNSILKDSKASEADYVYLRYSESAREAMIEESLGNPDRLTHEKVEEILRARDAESLLPLRERIEELESQQAELTRKLDETGQSAYRTDREKDELRKSIDQKNDEIARLKAKAKGGDRFRRQSSRNRPASKQIPAGRDSLEGEEAVQHQRNAQLAVLEAARLADAQRVNSLIDWIVRERTASARRWAWAVAILPILVLVFAVIAITKPDAVIVEWIPSSARIAAAILVIVLTALSLILGWNVRGNVIEWYEKRVRSRVRRELEDD